MHCVGERCSRELGSTCLIFVIDTCLCRLDRFARGMQPRLLWCCKTAACCRSRGQYQGSGRWHSPARCGQQWTLQGQRSLSWMGSFFLFSRLSQATNWESSFPACASNRPLLSLLAIRLFSAPVSLTLPCPICQRALVSRSLERSCFFALLKVKADQLGQGTKGVSLKEAGMESDQGSHSLGWVAPWPLKTFLHKGGAEG